MCDCQNSSNRDNSFKSLSNNNMTAGYLNSRSDGHRLWRGHNNASERNLNHTQDIENLYSSNETINNYVIATKESNQNISRADLAKLPAAFRKPVFSSLSNENKLRIFTEKINLLLATENLNQDEKNHLQSVLRFCKPEFYSGAYGNEVNSFAEQWINSAKNNFGWDKSKIGSYIGTILSPYEQKINNVGSSNPFYINDGNLPCECSKGVGDFCDNSHCGGTLCEPSGHCGWFWMQVCDGRCTNFNQNVKPTIILLNS